MRTHCYTVEAGDDGLLLGDYLRLRHQYSRRLIIQLKKGGITVNGQHRRMVDPVAAGDVIQIRLGETETINLLPNPDLQVPIVYEDADIIAFDKPAGMAVHPCTKYYNDSVGNYFAALFEKEGLAFRPLYRLDRDTTGLCLSAKNTLAASLLMGKLEKEYLAIVEGQLPQDEGTVDAPLIRVPGSIITRQVDPDGQRAVTHYRVLQRTATHTLLSLRLETGRTHQIRVHMAWLGYPLAGDTLYGGQDTLIRRQALHCHRLWLPASPERSELILTAPIPHDMAALLPQEGKNHVF